MPIKEVGGRGGSLYNPPRSLWRELRRRVQGSVLTDLSSTAQLLVEHCFG